MVNDHFFLYGSSFHHACFILSLKSEKQSKVTSYMQFFFMTVAQSICTHYSSFKNMGQCATLKKIGSEIWGAKNRVQKIGLRFFCFVFQKEKRQGLISSIFLKVPDPKKYQDAD